MLVVAEVFGPTFQGEGPSAGRRAMFLRLGRCNLDCAWCDTPYTWDWSRFDPSVELHHRPIDDVMAELDGIGADLLVITGGEPMLQQRELVTVVSRAHARGWRVEIETNGTIAPSAELAALVDQWNVSPKLSSAGIGRRPDPETLRAFAATGRAIAKFVVTDPSDRSDPPGSSDPSGPSELDEAAEVAAAGGLHDVWIMPEATDAATLAARLATLAPLVLARGWNLSSRLHVQLWGDERGH